jgi:hypothetical protein
LGAIVACLGYGVSAVLQSIAAKRAAEVVGLTGIVLIIKQVPYLLGLAVDAVAFAGNVLALQRLPLFLVQSDDWVILLTALVPAVIGLIGFRMKGRASTVVLCCAAGLGFTGVALASRGIGADDISWPLLLNPLLWAIIVHGAIGIAFFTVALQRDAVTLVTAITFVFEVVVPSVIGIVLFGNAIAPGHRPLAIAGFVLAIGGTVSLSRFAE